SKSSSRASRKVACFWMPALFTRISRPLICSTACATSRRQSATEPTSAAMKQARPPSARTCAKATRAGPPSLRPLSTTAAPSSASRRAIPRPMPWELPVTRATLLRHFMSHLASRTACLRFLTTRYRARSFRGVEGLSALRSGTATTADKPPGAAQNVAPPHPPCLRAIMATADLRKGYLLGLATFCIWGLFPLYFKAVEQYSALEIVTQRAIWSALFGSLVLLLWRHPGWWQELLAHPKRIGVLMISSVLIASNWLIYVWAVNNNHM